MSKVPQELIDEAAKRGIVEGATIKTATRNHFMEKLEGTSTWHMCSLGHVWTATETCIFDNSTNKWATVITPAPAKEEEGLKEGDACECGPAMRAAIVELAKELVATTENLNGSDTFLNPNLQWHADGRGLRPLSNRERTGDYWERLSLHTPEAFIAKMRVTAKRPKPIKIGGHTVVFNSGSIKVGCTTVDNATVRAIAEKLID